MQPHHACAILLFFDVTASQSDCATCWKPAALPASSITDNVTWRTVVYGKYYTGNCDRRANYFNVFHATNTSSPQKTLIHIHGGGFTGGSMSRGVSNNVLRYVNSGFTFISLNYRLVDTKYYFTDCSGNKHEEEFIAVSRDGVLSIPNENTDLLPMSSYKVRVGRQEFITKCIYDVVQAMDFIVSHASALNVDIRSIGFTTSSAGVALANYLILTYSRIYPGRFTPVSATFRNSQLDYPVQNAMDQVYGHFVDELGEDALLKDYLSESDCRIIVGNPSCLGRGPSSRDVDICNKTWHLQAVASFCGAGFEQLSFGQLKNSQVWPMSTEQDRGLAYLWYTSLQIEQYRPPGFLLYVFNEQGGASVGRASGGLSWRSFVHHAIYAKKYGDLCKRFSIKCIIYYPPWLNIRPASRGADVGDMDLMQTFTWNSSSMGEEKRPGSDGEMLLVHLYAASLTSQSANSEVSASSVIELGVGCLGLVFAFVWLV